MSARGAPADERAAGSQARAVEVISRWSALSRWLSSPGAAGAAAPGYWPGEARPRSHAARRGVERAPTRGEEQPRARAGCLRRVGVPEAASVASSAALAPCDAAEVLFWGPMGCLRRGCRLARPT